VKAFTRPYWYVLGAGLALIGAAFVFASQSLITYSRAVFINTTIYTLLQVTGWVILIEWLRLAGYLTLTEAD